MRGAGPGGEGVALLTCADAVHVGPLGSQIAVITTAVHDDEHEVVLTHDLAVPAASWSTLPFIVFPGCRSGLDRLRCPLLSLFPI